MLESEKQSDLNVSEHSASNGNKDAAWNSTGISPSGELSRIRPFTASSLNRRNSSNSDEIIANRLEVTYSECTILC